MTIPRKGQRLFECQVCNLQAYFYPGQIVRTRSTWGGHVKFPQCEECGSTIFSVVSRGAKKAIKEIKEGEKELGSQTSAYSKTHCPGRSFRQGHARNNTTDTEDVPF